MMRFEHKEYLYFLAVIAPVALLFLLFLWWRRRAIKRFGKSDLVGALIPMAPKFKHQVRFAFAVIALAFLIVGLANPQIGVKSEKVKRSGIDIMLALDVSNSMMAEDIKPSRLLKSKQFIANFINQLRNDRIGMIVFAGKAYLQMPLTVDYSAGNMYLKTVNTGVVPTQGTAIGDAIRLAIKAFESGERKHNALIVITDGENHEGDALEAAKEAADLGVVVYTVGVGSPKGAPIPIISGRNVGDYKRDKNESIVLSKLNETMLQQIAAQGNGKYYRLDSGREEIRKIMREIEGMEKKEFEERIFTDYEDQFQYFLGIALFFMILEFLISERRSRILSDWKIFGAQRA